MARLTFDNEDLNSIVTFMEECDIPLEKLSEVKAHIISTMTNVETYWYNEIRYFAEGLE